MDLKKLMDLNLNVQGKQRKQAITLLQSNRKTIGNKYPIMGIICSVTSRG